MKGLLPTPKIFTPKKPFIQKELTYEWTDGVTVPHAISRFFALLNSKKGHEVCSIVCSFLLLLLYSEFGHLAFFIFMCLYKKVLMNSH